MRNTSTNLQYTIKDLETLSGIKAHTIRIWEKRYGIISPDRTPTNIRRYSGDDLKRIINVSILNNHGLKISKIANLVEGELIERVKEISEEKTDYPAQIDQLVVTMLDLDEKLFLKSISELSHEIGFEQTVVNIIYPFLEKIGILWVTGSIHPAQEHFISNLIRQRLIAETDRLESPSGATKFVLYLPEHEQHEMTLLLMNYILRKNNLQSLYLGQSVPFDSLIQVNEAYNPDYIVTVLVHPLEIGGEEYIGKICEKFKGRKIIGAGAQLQNPDLKTPSNFRVIADSGEFKNLISSLK